MIIMTMSSTSASTAAYSFIHWVRRRRGATRRFGEVTQWASFLFSTTPLFLFSTCTVGGVCFCLSTPYSGPCIICCGRQSFSWFLKGCDARNVLCNNFFVRLKILHVQRITLSQNFESALCANKITWNYVLIRFIEGQEK